MSSRRFSDSFKMDAISYAKSSSVDAAIAQFGVLRSSLESWIKVAEQKGLVAESSCSSGDKSAASHPVKQTSNKVKVRKAKTPVCAAYLCNFAVPEVLILFTNKGPCSLSSLCIGNILKGNST